MPGESMPPTVSSKGKGMTDQVIQGLNVFLVGGAVRDQLLGYPYHEHDWVVVGSTPEEMLSRGFKSVGKDFPVFLHPQTHEEYALARTERKSGHGYTGFTVYAASDVTLEDDLVRRDLTINAIAQSPDGTLVDPYHGAGDIKQRLLRHVSPAFQEDPLRVLRVARFLARYTALDFSVAPETMALMQQMVASGELDHLVAERVWKETERALSEVDAHAYFELLNQVGALSNMIPAMNDQMYGLGITRLAHGRAQDAIGRWALLLSGLTIEQIEKVCCALTVPNPFRLLARALVQALSHWQDGNRNAVQWLEGFNALDVWRNPDRLARVLPLLNICAPEVDTATIAKAADAAKAISAQALLAQGFKGAVLGAKISDARRKTIECVLES